MTPQPRDALLDQALLNPAPNLPGLTLRPFNDGTLGLCAQLGLSFFSLDALIAAAPEGDRTAAVIRQLGFAEINRQCQMLFFMLGYGREALPPASDPTFAAKAAEAATAEPRAITEMLRLVQEPEAYQRHVLPWLLRQSYPGSLVPLMLAEWSRFMEHYLAASVKVLPRSEAGGDGDAPKN